MSRSLLRFGEFEYIPLIRELRRNGASVAIRAQNLDLLGFLLDNRDRAVPREELLNAIWPGVSVSDGVLSNAIYEVRTVLGDNGREQRMIRTLHGRGFRFVAEVVAEETEDAVSKLAVGRPNAAGGHAAPFVGREFEIENLTAALLEASAGRGGCLLVGGESGSGKTSVIDQFLLRSEATPSFFGHCTETLRDAPFWPWKRVLRQIAHTPIGAELLASAPEISAQISSITSESEAAAVEWGRDRERGSDANFRLFDAVGELLRNFAPESACVVVLEDLQWADAASLELLRFLSSEMARSTVLLLGTYRPEEMAAFPAAHDAIVELAHHAQFRSENLRDLEDRDVVALIRELLGVEPPADIVRAFTARVGGNPFVVGEFARSVQLRDSDDKVFSELVTSSEIPESVRERIESRVRGLSANVRAALEIAAALGADFELGIVRGLWENAAPFDRRWVEPCRAARVLAPVRGESGRWRFVHPIVHQCVYEMLPMDLRASLHQRAGERLEGSGGTANAGAAFGQRALEAAARSEPGRVGELSLRAGEAAIALFEYSAAVEHFQRASSAFEAQHAGSGWVFDASMGLAESWLRLGFRNLAGPEFVRGARLAKAAGDAERFARAVLGLADLSREGRSIFSPTGSDRVRRRLEESLQELGPEHSVLRARILARHAYELHQAEEFDAARSTMEEANTRAEKSDDPTLGVEIALLQRTLRDKFDDLAARIALSEHAADCAERVASPESIDAHFALAADRLEVGDMTGVDRELARCEALAVDSVEPRIQHRLAVLQSTLAYLRGDFSESARLSEAARLRGGGVDAAAEEIYATQACVLRREIGDIEKLVPLTQRVARDYLESSLTRATTAYFYAGIGRVDVARREFLRLVENEFEEIPRDGLWLATLATLAEVCWLLREEDQAAALYERMLPYAGRNVLAFDGVVALGSSCYGLGLLAICCRDWKAAEAHLEEAKAFNRKIGAVAWVARTVAALGVLHLERGEAADPSRAVELLSEAVVRCRQLGIHALLPVVESLRDEAKALA